MRVLAAAAILLALHVALAFALDTLGLVESLLSPSGLRALAVLPLVLGLYAVRLALLFVMPGLVFAALVSAGRTWRARRAHRAQARQTPVPRA
ncbi:Hypothetical protein CAP_7355 [Chondromyces apiculatus DSM 436]|uniref:Uncharacterized protein n=1 Tax=Chondromyces apiculatus DSM 436 TaxID=1192034 RepID=A0A017SZM3_9BACT|nr:Hypothetical protein CAP_7355 [Chondromyces apiculatus DSM 436]